MQYKAITLSLILTAMCIIGFSHGSSITTGLSNETSYPVRILGGNGYSTITNALDNASDGDVIMLSSGEFEEDLIIEKRVELVGEGGQKSVIIGTGNGDVVTVLRDGCYIRNLGIAGSGDGCSGILIKSDHNTVSECILSNCEIGIKLYGSSKNSIVNNTFQRNGRHVLNELDRTYEEEEDYLSAYWSFDNGPWNGTPGEIKDHSKNGNDGVTFKGVKSVKGVYGNASYFDGTNGIRVPDSDSLDVPDGFTIEAWINASTFQGNGNNSGNVIICKWMTNPVGQYFLAAYTGGNIVFKVADGYNNNTITAKNVLSVDEWYFITASWNRTYMSLYLNGELYKRINTTLSNLDQRDNQRDFVMIGYNDWGWAPFWYFHGHIDEMKIFNRSLGPDEVLDHYKGTEDSNKQGPVRLQMSMDYVPWIDYNGVVIDESEGRNDGKISGNVGHATYGKSFGVAVFNGAGCIDVTADMLIEPDDNFTISTWILTDAESDEMPLLNFRTKDQKSSSLSIGLRKGAFNMLLDDGTNDLNLTGDKDLRDGKWHHIALVGDGKKIEAYVDLDSIDSVDVKAGGASFTRMTLGEWDDKGYEGMVDELLIDSRSKSLIELGIISLVKTDASLMLISSDQNKIIGNSIKDNICNGIAILDSSKNEMNSNLIMDNHPVNIILSGSSYNNILRNDFGIKHKSVIQAIDLSDDNWWDDGIKGNYWSDMTGPDTDEDGIVDDEYDIFGLGGVDHYPLVRTNVTNNPPRITVYDVKTATVNRTYSNKYRAWDPEKPEDELSWTLHTNASWLALNNGSTLSGVPKLSDIGTYWVNMTVSDGELYDWSNFTLMVSKEDNDTGPQIMAFRFIQNTDLIISKNSLGNDVIRIVSVRSTENTKATITQNGDLIITPDKGYSGEITLELIILTSRGERTVILLLDVIPINNPPINLKIINLNPTYLEGEEIELEAVAIDPDIDDELVFYWEIVGHGTYSGDVISFKLSAGRYRIILMARDLAGGVSVISEEFEVLSRGNEIGPSEEHHPWILYLTILMILVIGGLIGSALILTLRKKGSGKRLEQPSVDENFEPNIRSGQLYYSNEKDIGQKNSNLERIISDMIYDESTIENLEYPRLRSEARRRFSEGMLSDGVYIEIGDILNAIEE